MEKINKKVLRIIILLLLIPILFIIFLSFTNLKDKNTYSSSTNFDTNYVDYDINNDSSLKSFNTIYPSLYITAIGLVFLGAGMYVYLYKKKEW